MGIQLVSEYLGLTDEQFTAESSRSIVTNQEFDFSGAHTVYVWNIGTAPMNDYDRTGDRNTWHRYGNLQNLDAITEEFTLKKDRSFTFAVDRLDWDQTRKQLEAAKALARQNREVTFPEIEAYTYGVMVEKSGTKAEPQALTAENIYDCILAGSEEMDNAMVPDKGRFIIVTPNTYRVMKKSPEIILNTDIGQEMKLKGVVAEVDGLKVLKVPANRLPDNFGFLMGHPSATCAPMVLEDFSLYDNPQGISGFLVEGRVVYDACVFGNKKKALYYHAIA